MTDVEKQADAIVHAVPRLASESGTGGQLGRHGGPGGGR